VSDGPFVTSTTWSDAFHNDMGFTWMDAVAVVSEDVVLSQILPLGSASRGEDVWALTAGSDGKIYLGTSGAFLSVYDPASGSIAGLGAPVPDECQG
jgi:hypothetical protein